MSSENLLTLHAFPFIRHSFNSLNYSFNYLRRLQCWRSGISVLNADELLVQSIYEIPKVIATECMFPEICCSKHAYYYIKNLHESKARNTVKRGFNFGTGH